MGAATKSAAAKTFFEFDRNPPVPLVFPAVAPEVYNWVKQLVDWWPARVQLINRVAGAHAVKLRFNHPTTGEIRGVTPMITRPHSAITRPRIWGEVADCSIVFAVTSTVMVAKPTGICQPTNQPNCGANAASTLNST